MTHWGPVVARTGYEHGDLTVIDCEHCGWAHLYPLPSEEEVKAFYEADGPYPDDSWFDKELEEHEKGYWEAYYQSQVDMLSSENILIDWGCGAGFFPDWYYRHTGRCFGIEPSPRARAYGCVHSPLDPIILPDTFVTNGGGRFSGRAALVLEHLVDPLGFLKIVHGVIEDKVLIVVPNEMSNLQKKVGGNWWVHEHHINYFTPQSLRRILWRAGFAVTYETATFPLELFIILLGLDYRNNDELGRKCHEFRLKFEKRFSKSSFALYHLLYKKFGWGRELVFVAEKA